MPPGWPASRDDLANHVHEAGRRRNSRFDAAKERARAREILRAIDEHSAAQALDRGLVTAAELAELHRGGYLVPIVVADGRSEPALTSAGRALLSET
jgi:hypothetical protein